MHGSAFASTGAYGIYALSGQNASFAVGRDAQHNYVSITPGTLLLTLAKAGTGIGPAMVQAGATSCATVVGCPAGTVIATVGEAYSVVGWSFTLANDYALPLLTQGDWKTGTFNGGVELTAQIADRVGETGKKLSPFIGSAVDLIQGLCYDTGCRR